MFESWSGSMSDTPNPCSGCQGQGVKFRKRGNKTLKYTCNNCGGSGVGSWDDEPQSWDDRP